MLRKITFLVVVILLLIVSFLVFNQKETVISGEVISDSEEKVNFFDRVIGFLKKLFVGIGEVEEEESWNTNRQYKSNTRRSSLFVIEY